MMADIPHREATGEELGAAARVVRDTESQIHRRLDTTDLPELLYNNLEHPRWDDVADRCLSCTNCTMVCPTCFCHSIEDVPDLSGQRSERVRVWDSCFNLDHAHTAGGNMRPDIRSRYRQWLTHKLAVVDRSVWRLGLRRLRALHHVVPGGDRHHRGSGRDSRRNERMTSPVTNPTIGRSATAPTACSDRTTRSVRIRRSCGRSSRRRPAWRHSRLEFQDHERAGAVSRPARSVQHDLRARGRRGADLGLAACPDEGPGIGHTIRFVGRVTRRDRQAGAGRGPGPARSLRSRLADRAGPRPRRRAGGGRSGPGPAAARGASPPGRPRPVSAA